MMKREPRGHSGLVSPSKIGQQGIKSRRWTYRLGDEWSETRVWILVGLSSGLGELIIWVSCLEFSIFHRTELER